MQLRKRTERIMRWLKFKYLQLLRAKGGPSIVAKGFSVGLAIEMFTLPTLGLAALLILPVVYLLRASLPAALLGFLFGKIIYLPLAFLNRKVGAMLVPDHLLDGIHFHSRWLNTAVNFLQGALDLIVGGIVVGTALGILFYFPIRKLLELYTEKRLEKRRSKKTLEDVHPAAIE